MEGMKQEKKIAEVLGEFVVSQKYEALPKETIEKAKMLILDVIGCIVGASKEEQSEALLEVLKDKGGEPESTVFARGFKTSATNAALLNGTMGHIFELDDDHRLALMHSSVVVLPAVFALGEKLKVSGKELIRAFILGSEVMIRVGESYLGEVTVQGVPHDRDVRGIWSGSGMRSVFG